MLSFTTRVVNGATEIVYRDGQWTFATNQEIEMIKRIEQIEAALYPFAMWYFREHMPQFASDDLLVVGNKEEGLKLAAFKAAYLAHDNIPASR